MLSKMWGDLDHLGSIIPLLWFEGIFPKDTKDFQKLSHRLADATGTEVQLHTSLVQNL